MFGGSFTLLLMSIYSIVNFVIDHRFNSILDAFREREFNKRASIKDNKLTT